VDRSGQVNTTQSSIDITYPGVPDALVREYAKAARERAAVKRYTQDGTYFASVPGCQGVWATGGTQEEALAEVESVVFDWTQLKLKDRDDDFTPFGNLNPNTWVYREGENA
jgi:predicted RNase H-like HicB family nuclease